MSKFLLGILASVAFVSGAMAADLPRKEPPPGRPDWQGPDRQASLWQRAGRRAVLTGMDYP